MKLLFAHRVYPGQFRNLLRFLDGDPRHQVKFLALDLHEPPLPSVEALRYQPARSVHTELHPCLSSTENAVLFGQAAWRAAMAQVPAPTASQAR